MNDPGKPKKSEKAKEPEQEDLWGQRLESIYVHSLSEWLEEMIHLGKAFVNHTSALDDGLEQHEPEPTDEIRELTALFVDAYIDWKFGNDE